tara:strand:- start:175 stop:798 length:624 start_codon:yes stop_codon:yes gene_type:complete
MLVKEKFLKTIHKLRNKFFLILFISCLFSNSSISETKTTSDIAEYIIGLKNFKCNFIQANPDGSISEGTMIYSDKKIRIDYESPSKIIFIAREKKAMYFNKDLEEVHYFNPNKTAFNIFNSIFDLNNLSKDLYTIKIEESVIEILMNNLNVEDIKVFKIIFQNNPLLLKKIIWEETSGKSVFSVYNIEKNPLTSKRTFSMAHPLINN